MSAPALHHGANRRRWIALAVVCLAMLMNTLDGSVVNVALPAIGADLDIPQNSLSWIINAYLIAFGSFLLMAGRLGDLIGRKRVFLSGVTIFTLASVLCGFAQSEAMLIGARFLQGLGGAVSASVIIAMIVTEFPEPAERAKAMSAYIFVAVGGGSIGLLVGGIVTHALDWHWIFFINIPIGAATVLLGRALLDENQGLGLDQGVDIVGSVAVTLSLMLGIYAIVTTTDHGWGSLHTIGFAVASLLLLAGFLSGEARVANPIMPLRILRVPGLVSTSVVRGLLATGLFSTFFLGALYLERVRGYNALRTGVAFLPLSLIVGAFSAGITAYLMGRFGARRVMLPGLVFTFAGLLLLARLGEHTRVLPRHVLRPADPRAGCGHGVHPAARDRDGTRAERGRGPRLGHRQRLAADVGGDRPGRARDGLDQPRAHAAERGAQPAQRAHERLPAGLPGRRRLRGARHPRGGRPAARAVALHLQCGCPGGLLSVWG